MDNKYQDINNLLNNILKPESLGLKELFEKKLVELNINSTTALEILNIQTRTLKGILNSSQKIVDVTNLIKIANFLQLPKEKVIQLYLDALEKNYTKNNVSPEVIKFIQSNFDLATLKKEKFISSITDFEEIEEKIKSFFGLTTIFEYSKPKIEVAFSAGLVKPKNELSRSFWIQSSNRYFEEINNPYEFNRKALIDYFPNIRWHSTNVEFGLKTIIKDLFKLGITIIYQAPLSNLHLRGAVFSVNEKPCIVLTNYKGFYGTLWFALIHELYHILFDWDEIKNGNYHFSEDINDDTELLVQEKENEANYFAREYLFPNEKMKMIKNNLNNHFFVTEFAKNNNVHTSIIYVFSAYDSSSTNRSAWARAKKYEPDILLCLKNLENPWSNPLPIKKDVGNKKNEIYN